MASSGRLTTLIEAIRRFRGYRKRMSAPVGQAKFDHHRGEVYRRSRCRSDVLSDYDFSTINDLDVEWFSTEGSQVHGDNGASNRGYVSDSIAGPDMTAVGLSDFDEDIALLKEDPVFQSKVSRKMKVYLISKQEAEVETLLDHIVNNQGGPDEALLYVISAMYNEMKVETLTRILLNRGASPLAMDSERKTPLHHAVQRGFYSVCLRLLESEVDPLAKDKDGRTPFDLALKDKNDNVAGLILQYVPAKKVRSMFTAPNQKHATAEYKFHRLIQKNLLKTAVAVLDCTLEPCSTTGRFRVNYHIQEADERGRAPTHPDFKKNLKSSFQLIAESGKPELGLHDAVRLLVRRKWKLFARFRFQINAMAFLFSLICLTYAAVIASLVKDPMDYSSPLQTSRAVVECIVIISSNFSLLLELIQMKRTGLDYWRDRYNWQDLLSTLLILTVVPLRIYALEAQWTVFSIGYLLWTFRIFKYAPIFGQTGAYAQTLWHVFYHDFPQFIVLFVVVLLAFSGSFLLALKGENLLGKHEETSSFWHILYTGVRTLIEGEKVVEYTGEDARYGPLGSILMVCFLLTVNILLLNILIAQLSDAYQNVQHEAKRVLVLNRARIVTRVEINSILTGKGFRSRYYTEVEEIANLSKALSKWDTNGHDKMSSSKGITDQMEMHEQSLFTIKNRLIRQEQRVVNQSRALEKLQQDVKRILELNLRGTTSPEFFKAASTTNGNGYSNSNGNSNGNGRRFYRERRTISDLSFSSGDRIKERFFEDLHAAANLKYENQTEGASGTNGFEVRVEDTERRNGIMKETKAEEDRVSAGSNGYLRPRAEVTISDTLVREAFAKDEEDSSGPGGESDGRGESTGETGATGISGRVLGDSGIVGPVVEDVPEAIGEPGPRASGEDELLLGKEGAEIPSRNMVSTREGLLKGQEGEPGVDSAVVGKEDISSSETPVVTGDDELSLPKGDDPFVSGAQEKEKGRGDETVGPRSVGFGAEGTSTTTADSGIRRNGHWIMRKPTDAAPDPIFSASSHTGVNGRGVGMRDALSLIGERSEDSSLEMDDPGMNRDDELLLTKDTEKGLGKGGKSKSEMKGKTTKTEKKETSLKPEKKEDAAPAWVKADEVSIPIEEPGVNRDDELLLSRGDSQELEDITGGKTDVLPS